MTKVKYLNEKLKNKHFYNGPKSLFKYRPFDEWTFEMLEENYLYFRQAKKEDDETECLTELDNLNYLSIKLIRTAIIDVLLDDIRVHTTENNFEYLRQLVFQCADADMKIRNNYLIDYSHVFRELVQDYNSSPLINYLAAIPNSVDSVVLYQFYILLTKAAQAREDIGICSLTESPFIDDLWNRYADKGSGYCIEYEIEDCDWITDELFPVIYEDQREYGVLICLCRNYVSNCINKMRIEYGQKDASQYLRLFISKFKKWSQQREWRLLGEKEEHRKAPKIRRIYLGKNIDESNKQKMMDYCREHQIEIVAS